MTSKLQPSRCFWIAGIAFAIALLLLVLSKFGIPGGTTLAEITVQPEHYATAITYPDSFEVPAGSSPLFIQYEAPVDQSWVYLECQLLRPSQEVAAEFAVKLENYYGIIGGQLWRKGGQFGHSIVSLEGSGPFRLRVVKAVAGFGEESTPNRDRPAPPVTIDVQSGLGAARFTSWTICGFSMAGVAFLLRGFTPRNAKPVSAQAAPDARPQTRYLFLDGLRGVAALAVLICHFFQQGKSPNSFLAPLLSESACAVIHKCGEVGVEVFFVLSGFVMAHSLWKRRVTPGFAGRFVVRRAIRLDPPYYIALGLAFTMIAANHMDGFIGAFREIGGWPATLSNAFYLHDLLGYETILDVSWTLCLEIQFYLVLIVLHVIASQVTRLKVLGGEHAFPGVILCLVLPLVLLSIAAWYPEMKRFTFLGTWSRFGLGVLTYLAFRGGISRIWWALPTILLVGLSVAFFDLRSIVATCTASLILFAGSRGKLGSWLSNIVIQFFGKLSYSIYLVHIPLGIGAIRWLSRHLEPSPVTALALLLIGFAVSIAGALAMYHLFESPGVEVSHRLKGGKPDAPPKLADQKGTRPDTWQGLEMPPVRMES